MNAERQLTQFTHGNGIQTTQTFNPETGRLEAIQAGTGNSVQNLTYQWDTLGNLLSRSDAAALPNATLTEEFAYDALNRLTEAGIVEGATKTYAYDAIGNITSKSDTGTYSYPTPGPSAVRPHAVTSVTGALNATYAYDANGNLTSGAGRTVTWMSFNMVATVQRGTNTLGFTYDSEHQRIKQYVSGTGETTIYVNAEVRVEKVLDSGGNLIRWNNYIYAPSSGGGGGMVAVEYDHATATDQTRYFHKDHLGSISVITDEAGTVVERLSYDSWGMRRFLNGADDMSETIGSSTDRGFTGHEHLQEVGLVHMNGRIYDPRLGRFMSADPHVQDPFNTQSLNRYSYVINNPLAYTDPNGYFFKSIARAIKSAFSNPIVRAVVAIAAAATMQFEVLPALGITNGFVAAGISGFTGGIIGGGDLKSGIIGAATGMAFFGVGELTGHGVLAFGSPEHLANVAGHALVGCASAAASGGKCGAGALAGGAGSFAGPLIPSNNMVVRMVAHAVIGGAAAKLGGGKFENGAVTAAFGYLFNELGNNRQRGYGWTTEESAARAGVNAIYDDAQGKGWEYSGAVYKDSSGGYDFTDANTLKNPDASPPFKTPWPSDAVVEGYYLVKVAPTPTYTHSAEQIEFPDKGVADKYGIRAYVGTPKGRFLQYTPGDQPFKGTTNELELLRR